MMEQLRAVLRGEKDPQIALSLSREYLQVRILEGLQRCGAMVPLAFHGGTALRLLFATPRFSEDLDFALERPEYGPFDLSGCLDRIRHSLQREGYEVSTDAKPDRTVQIGWVRFAGLLQDLGLASTRAQRIHVKIEIDTDPPAGATLETTRLTRFVPLHLQHHDRASLLAGKVAAVLTRPWTKGRDLFDLFWYLGDRDWPTPNATMLANALRQAGQDVEPGSLNWKERLREKLTVLDWGEVRRDVAPFLRDREAAGLFTREYLMSLLTP